MPFGLNIGTQTNNQTSQSKFGLNAGTQTATAVPTNPQSPVVKTLSPSIGGGALNIIPGQPNTVANTGHTTYGGEKSQAGKQRDDIVPVGLGGANSSPANIRMESNKMFGLGKGTDTDPIELKNINDYKSGKIGLAEARANVLQAKQQQMGLSPTKAQMNPYSVTNLAGGVKDTLANAFSSVQKAIKNGFSPGVQSGKMDPQLALRLSERGAVDIQGKPILGTQGAQQAVTDKKNNLNPATHLPQGSVIPPGPTTLREALPKNEPLKFSLNPKEQQISPNAKSDLTLQSAIANAQQYEEIKNKLAQERPGDFSPFAAPLTASTLFLGPEFIDAPLATSVKTGIFTGLQAVENKLNLHLSNLVPDSAGENSKQVADILQMLGNGLVSHGIYEKAPDIADTFTKNTITQYNLPKTVYIPAETVRDIFQTGKLATPEEMRQFGEITGGNREMIHHAIENGLDVAIPAQKVVSITDRPYWAAIKDTLGLKPTAPVVNTWNIGEVAQAPKGLIGNKNLDTYILPSDSQKFAQVIKDYPQVLDNLPAPEKQSLLSSPQTILNLPAPNGKTPIQGEGFTMADKADKGQLAISKALNGFREAVSSFNSKPTSTKLQNVLDTRETLKNILDASQLGNSQQPAGVFGKLAKQVDVASETSPRAALAKGTQTATIESIPALEPQGVFGKLAQNSGAIAPQTTQSIETPKPVEPQQGLFSRVLEGQNQPQVEKPSETPANISQERAPNPLKPSQTLSNPLAEQPKSETGSTPSGIGKSIEAKAIEAKLTKGFSEVAGYDSHTFKEQSEKAAAVIDSGIDRVTRIVKGEEQLPEGLRGAPFIAGVEEYLKKNPNVDLQYALANSPLTSGVSQSASDLSLSRMREQDSATMKLQEIKKLLEEKAKAEKISKSKTKKELKTATEIKLSNEEASWDKFLEEIKC